MVTFCRVRHITTISPRQLLKVPMLDGIQHSYSMCTNKANQHTIFSLSHFYPVMFEFNFGTHTPHAHTQIYVNAYYTYMYDGEWSKGRKKITNHMLNGHNEQQFGIVIRNTFIVISPNPYKLGLRRREDRTPLVPSSLL